MMFLFFPAKMKLLIIAAVIIFINLSCNTVEPPEDDIKPGRRDYVWSVDTIPVDNSVMKDIWGSSPTDIWICGDGFDRRQSLWHYDGKIFTPYNEYILSATSFCGFERDNVWMATSSGWIYHYNGVEWKKDTTLSLTGYNDVVIQSLYGISPDNIYATGMAVSLEDYKGVIVKYDGKSWKYLNIPNTRANFTIIKFDGSTKTFLLRGANFDGNGTSERLYSLNSGQLEEIYAGTKGLYIGAIADRVYIYGEQIIYKYNGTSLEQYLDLRNTNFLGGISGRNEKDLFCNTVDYENDFYGIGHWNGTDLATLYISMFKSYRTLFFEDEIIFLAGNYANADINVIIKGKLISK